MRRGPWIWVALLLMLVVAAWRWFSDTPRWRQGQVELPAADVSSLRATKP